MKNETVNFEEGYFSRRLEEKQNKKLEEVNNKPEKKKNKKGIIIGIIAIILAAATGITAFILSKRNNKNNKPDPTQITTSAITLPEETTLPIEETMGLDGLGQEYEQPTLEEEKELEKVTGDVDKDKIVVDDEGNVWVDQEAADNKDKVGQEVVDTKDDTLVVKPNGDVFVKEEENEIQKEDGTTDVMDEEEFEDEYVYDENLDSEVKKEDVNKFVEVDANYYNLNGELVYAKGERVTKETFEKIKNDPGLTTTKPVVKEEQSTIKPTIQETKPTIQETTKPSEPTVPETTIPETEESFVPAEGILNEDGTYTVDGLTFESKADYQQWIIQGYEGYGVDSKDGIMKPIEEMLENINQKTK